MDFETTRLIKRALPLATFLSAILAVLSLATILRLGRDIFVPISLAILLSFVLAPGVRALQRLGVTRGLAVATVAISTFGAAIGLTVLAGSQIGGLGSELPRYQATIREKINRLGDTLTPGGSFGIAIDSLQQLAREFSGETAGAQLDRSQATTPAPIVVKESSGWLATLGLIISPLLHPLATAALILLLVIFVLNARDDLRNRLVRLLGTDDIQRTTEVIDDAARRLGRLFLAQLALNVGFAVVVSVGLWVIGIPSPILFGMIVGCLRFVPYIGSIAGVLPPLLLALAIDPGWGMFIQTALFFAVVEPLLGQAIEPLILGQRTGLAPIAVVISATVWTFLWGPIGLILSTPLTVCLVVLGRHVDRLGFLDVMLGDRPALSPAQLFYQRMLAGDPTETIIIAKEFLRERALATYYDEVALEGLRLAHQDVARGRLSSERMATLLRATDVLIDNLDHVRDPRPRGGMIGSEAAAAISAAGPDQRVTGEVLSAQDLREDWRGPNAVVCYAQRGSLDEVIGKMLVQVVRKHGVNAAIVTGTRTENVADRRSTLPRDVRLICLSFIDPLSTLHLRHAVRVAHRELGPVQVVIGIWRERDPSMGLQIKRSSRADAVVPTITKTLAQIIGSARTTPTA